MSDDGGIRGRVVRFAKGETLFTQGEDTHNLYVVRSGLVRVFKTESGMDVDLAEGGPGAVVGEVAAVDGKGRSATVTAVEDTEALEISGENFQAISRRLPDWLQKITKVLVHRLREADEKMDFIAGDDKTAQVAALVHLMLVKASAASSGGGLAQATVENEIVDLLLLSPAQAAETLEALQSRGLVTLNRGEVAAPNMAKLEGAANQLYDGVEAAPLT